ncbi:MAG: TonB-dependent receptor [Candidatus Berkelbacteria bacterium]|nr:TonB-dependent receptor [Candidatus Berkelbacteria bacterium]
MKYRNFKAALLVFVFCQAGAMSAVAEEGDDPLVPKEDDSLVLEEVLVTAQLRSQSLLDVPMTVTALSGDSLTKQNINDMAGWTDAIVGINFDQAWTGQRTGTSLTIRGVYNTRVADTSAGIGTATTAFYIDDVPVMSVDPGMFDVDRIEVLKGPQGTLYGATAMGGAVKIIRNQADSTKFATRVEGSFANTRSGDASYNASAMFNLPLFEDKLAVRAVAFHRFDGGFVDWHPPALEGGVRGCFDLLCSHPEFSHIRENEIDTENMNDQTTEGFRGMFKFTPTDNLVISGGITSESSDIPFSHAFDRNLNQGLVQERYVPNNRNTDFSLANLTVKYAMPFADFIAVTGWNKRTHNMKLDFTTYYFNRLGGSPTGGIAAPAWIAFDWDSTAFTQEMRLASNEGGRLLGGKVDWLIGAFYIDETRRVTNEGLAPGFNQNAATPTPGFDQGLVQAVVIWSGYEQKSVFGDATVHFGEEDQFSISAGLRYSEQDSRQSSVLTGELYGYRFFPREQPTTFGDESKTPRANIAYKLGDNKLVYASAAKGFRAGGLGISKTDGIFENTACADALSQIGITQATATGSFYSDSIWNYEIGAKMESESRKFRANVSGFLIDWTDLQQNVILANFNEGCVSTVNANTGKASIKGFEVDITTLPFDGVPFTLHAALSYAKARLDDPSGGIGTAGDRIPNTPDWSASVSGEYEFPILNDYSGYFRLGVNYTGDMIASVVKQDDPFNYIPSHVLVNANLTVYSTEDLGEITLFANNLLDELVITGAGTVVGESFTNSAGVGRPRTIGIRYSKDFDL